MSQGFPGNDEVMTRRQFHQSVLLVAGAVLLDQPLALFEGLRSTPKSAPDPAPLRKALRQRMSLASRSDWTRLSPRYSRLKPADPYSRITIHHEGNKANFASSSPDVTRELRQVMAAHRRKGYGDIGYHFMIDYSGRTWEGRSLKYQGAHVSSRNPGNIGVMLLGNFEIQKPSKAQKAALIRLVTDLRRYYGIRRRRIYGHRDMDSTLCPGRNLYAFLPTLSASTG
ncbi:MAG: peptidoglycan recognition protein family protein [Kiritimatiellae bacterium]|nr:peptidoglycan recognition protein family protein [Kiritimatiellia bacterium]